MKQPKALVAGLIIVLIITSIAVIKNAADKRAEENRGITQEGAQRVTYDRQWPDSVNIRLEGDDATYSISNAAVYKNGVVSDSEADKVIIERVKRVAYFYQWMKQDPILFGVGFEIEKTSDAVQALEKLQKEYLRTNNDTDNFFATNFLSGFIEASKTYEAFDKDMSEQNAKKLIESVKQANEAYRKDIASLQKIINGFENTGQKIAFLDGKKATDVKTILSDLTLMQKNQTVAKSEIAKREQCLLESSDACGLPVFELPQQNNIQSIDENVRILSPEILNFKSGIAYDGPYQINSTCWDKTEKHLLYVSNECPEKLGYCFQKSVLATNAYFVELFPEQVAYKKSYAAGIRSIPQSATTPYDCNDLEYQQDLTAVRAMVKKFGNDRIFEFIKANKGFAGQPDGFKAMVEKGTELENEFFEAKYPSQDSLKQLADYYAYVYGRIYDTGIGNLADAERMLERHTAAAQKLEDLHLLLNKARFHFANLFENMRTYRGELTISDIYVYPIRSHYALMFLNASEAVWRLDERPTYVFDIQQLGSDQRKGVNDYAYMVSKYGKEAILRWQRQYNEDERLNPYYR